MKFTYIFLHYIHINLNSSIFFILCCIIECLLVNASLMLGRKMSVDQMFFGQKSRSLRGPQILINLANRTECILQTLTADDRY
jgi:hypothetical protein